MADELNLQYSSTKKWNKKTAWMIFFVFSGLFVLAILAFLGLIGYYAWNIKYGDAETVKGFNSKFTIATDFPLDKRPKIEQNANDFVYPNSPTFGNEQASITVLAFLDFECPYSQEAYPTFKKLMQKYQSNVKFVFKHFPIASIHDDATQASIASDCADEQGKFWEYYDLLFNSKGLDGASLVKYAKQLNLNMDQFQKCLITQKNREKIEKDLADGITLGVRGTPTYIVNDLRIEGVTEMGQWDEIIVKQLQNRL